MKNLEQLSILLANRLTKKEILEKEKENLFKDLTSQQNLIESIEKYNANSLVLVNQYLKEIYIRTQKNEHVYTTCGFLYYLEYSFFGSVINNITTKQDFFDRLNPRAKFKSSSTLVKFNFNFYDIDLSCTVDVIDLYEYGINYFHDQFERQDRLITDYPITDINKFILNVKIFLEDHVNNYTNPFIRNELLGILLEERIVSIKPKQYKGQTVLLFKSIDASDIRQIMVYESVNYWKNTDYLKLINRQISLCKIKINSLNQKIKNII